MTQRWEPIGRERELAEAARTLDVATHSAAALVLSGPAGIGKTTIWRAVIEEAGRRGFVTLRTRAVEAEARLGFSGLADLLDPCIDEVLPELPPAQRVALEVALQRVPAGRTAPPPLAVSIGTTAALRLLAARAPVLVAVDDLPWLDGPTARVLEYAARRVADSPVAFAATLRDSGEGVMRATVLSGFEGSTTTLSLGPLPVEAIDEVIRHHLGLSLRRPALTRIQRDSGGNPFFALAIARADATSAAAPGEPREAAASPAQRLARERLDALTPSALRTLAVAAALGRPTLELLRAVVPGAEDDVTAAVAAGVLEIDADQLHFSHPLLAEAAYQSLAEADRRRLHAELATIVDGTEERAQHLALSCDGPDDIVADALDRAVIHARGRGASDAAAEFALEAVRRTAPDASSAIHRRVIEAGHALIRAGDPDRARAVLEPYVASVDHGPRRAEALRLLADARSSDDWDAKTRVLEEALADAAGDHGLRSMILSDLVAVRFNTVADGPGMLALAITAVEEAEAQDDAVVRSLAYQAAIWAQWLAGDGRADDLIERDLALAAQVEHEPVFRWPAFMQALLDDFGGRHAEAASALRRLQQVATRTGDWDSLAIIGCFLADAEFERGAWQAAHDDALEAERASRLNGQAFSLAQALQLRAAVQAARGSVGETERLATEAIAVAQACGGRSAELDARAVLGFLALSRGDASAAVVGLEPAVRARIEGGFLEPDDLRRLPDLAEALILLDRAPDARSLLAGYEDAAVRLDRASARAASLRIRGLLAAADNDEAGAEAAFDEALQLHRHVDEPFEEARTLLAAGQSRRRFRRRGRARETLRRAVEILERLGARLWLERASAELARTGHREAGSTLSPTERQIAELVMAGHTNREVAEALFMSPHTVEAHLTRVYRSLGIRGRTELARVLAADASTTSAPQDPGRDGGHG